MMKRPVRAAMPVARIFMAHSLVSAASSKSDASISYACSSSSARIPFVPTPPRQRRERELAQRRQLIIESARELAEAEGWSAVTTRRLADKIEYSQPVLYQHFAG